MQALVVVVSVSFSSFVLGEMIGFVIDIVVANLLIKKIEMFKNA
jgi:hypothetical protein